MDGGEPYRNGPETKAPTVVELTVPARERPPPYNGVIATLVASIVVINVARPTPSTLVFILLTTALVATIQLFLRRLENVARVVLRRTRVVIDPTTLTAYVERISVARGLERTLQLPLAPDMAFVVDRVHRAAEPELMLRVRRDGEVIADIIRYALEDADRAAAAVARLSEALAELAPALAERARATT